MLRNDRNTDVIQPSHSSVTFHSQQRARHFAGPGGSGRVGLVRTVSIGIKRNAIKKTLGKARATFFSFFFSSGGFARLSFETLMNVIKPSEAGVMFDATVFKSPWSCPVRRGSV